MELWRVGATSNGRPDLAKGLRRWLHFARGDETTQWWRSDGSGMRVSRTCALRSTAEEQRRLRRVTKSKGSGVWVRPRPSYRGSRSALWHALLWMGGSGWEACVCSSRCFTHVSRTHDAPALSSAVPVHTTVDTYHNLNLCGVRQIIIYVKAFKAVLARYRRGEREGVETRPVAAGKL